MESIDYSKQNPETPVMKPALEYAVIFSLITIALFAIGHYSGFEKATWWRLLTFAASVAMVGWMIWNFRDKKNEGFLRLGQGVKLSFLTGIFAGIIGGVFTYIFITVITPDFMDSMQNEAIAQMEAQGLSEEQITQSLKFTGMFMSPVFMFLSSVLGSIISYVLLGLIFSAIMKRN